ncbi:MAG: hypothetical protein IPL49_18700 [Saprospirales bacterium]|nr:hypothetical protein [Saprospirales bacterium]MBK8492853.1 hypothetical protein [Saprospirales bacterium]
MEENNNTCDPAKTHALETLFEVPKEARDESWLAPFLEAIPTAGLASADPQVLSGPDGFPYFALYSPQPGQDFEPFCIQQLIPDLLLRNGVGVAINPSPEGVDWVFTYGDILNWHLRGVFYSPVTEPQEPVEEEEPGTLIIEKTPDDVLPMKAREVLRGFLKSKGVARPQAFLLCQTTENDILKSLVFNIFEEDFDTPEAFNTLMEQVQWFLPKHYYLSRVPNDNQWNSYFSDL